MMSEEEITEDAPPIVSERVQALAKQIYEEFEGLVNDYGPESIASLMPLVVNILENLDSALSDNQDNLNAVMELNEENQQLVVQYEKEKSRRKETEEKALKMEESIDEERNYLKEKLSHLQIENKSMQTKLRNQSEQIDKLDERYEQQKREYKELHERNTELIRNFHGQIENLKESAAIRISEARRGTEDDLLTPTPSVIRAPGFNDFTSDRSNKKKRRQQPIAPRSLRGRAFSQEDEDLIGTTPAVGRLKSPDIEEEDDRILDRGTPNNMLSLAQEYPEEEEDEQQLPGEEEEFPGHHQYMEEGVEDMEPLPELHIQEEVPLNEQSLMAEMGGSENFLGLDDILMENKQLLSEKDDLSREVETLTRTVMDLQLGADEIKNEKESLDKRVQEMDNEIKSLKKDLQENKEQLKKTSEASEKATGPEALRISRLEIAKVLRERNEWKEKYFSLLEQVRMNDELYLFKKKDKKSRWVDYFAALFSSSKRRTLEQSLVEGSAHRPILMGGVASPGKDSSEQDTHVPVFSGAGFRNTNIVPTLKRVGKKEDEVYLTAVSWVIPTLSMADDGVPLGSPTTHNVAPNINTCRPMSFQDEGATILCSVAVNFATFLSDCLTAVSVPKGQEVTASVEESSMSLVWICTGTENLTKVSVLDAAAVGEVIETFAVCSTPIGCMIAVPEYDDTDSDVLASLSTKVRKPTTAAVKNALSERPSSKLPTIWMGADSGELYVHSATSQWKKCIHADKMPSGVKSMVYSKGKVFALLQNSSLAVFRRFPDGEWDWDNYEIATIAQKKNLSVTAVAAVKYNIWCAIGNTVHVVHSHHLRNEATFTVHAYKNAEVRQMLTVGEGVWVVFKHDSVLRLFHGTSFTHMQDLDVAPSIHKILVFGSEKRSAQMPVPVSCITAAQNSLWVGTENGIILSYPFTHPTSVGEESGWEVIKEAEVGYEVLPEPFDVRTETALDASLTLTPPPSKLEHTSSPNSTPSTSSPIHRKGPAPQPFNPFCNIDQVQLSIHCHVNAVNSLCCIPGMAANDSVYEPLGGVYIGPGDQGHTKPTLFVLSCGQGHLDLRTADKVMQTIHAQEAGRGDLPMASSIISEKNYIMVWDVIV